MSNDLNHWIKARMPSAGAANDNVFALFKSCLAQLIYHRTWLDETLHHDSVLHLSPFWSEVVPHSEHVTTRYPWDASDDTPTFTGLPVDVLYMAKVESLTKKLEEMWTALLSDNSRVVHEVLTGLTGELDKRSVGGEGYGLSREMDHKLDKLLQQMTAVRPVQLPLPEQDSTFDAGGIEEDDYIEISFEEKTALHARVIDESIKHRQKQQIQNRKKNGLLVGFHHGVLNPLPSTWTYPTKMSLIQLITLHQMGSPAESVPPLKYISCKQVAHFDKHGVGLRRIKRILKVVKYFAEQRNVWTDGQWDGESVTCLWDGIFEDVRPFLLTVTKSNDGKPDSYHKSKCGNLSW